MQLDKTTFYLHLQIPYFIRETRRLNSISLKLLHIYKNISPNINTDVNSALRINENWYQQ